MSDFIALPLRIASRRQIERESGMSVGIDMLAQPLRNSINQSAFLAMRADHHFALPAFAAAQRVGKCQRYRFELRAGEFVSQMRAPRYFEAAISALQRCDLHTFRLQQGQPGTVRT